MYAKAREHGALVSKGRKTEYIPGLGDRGNISSFCFCLGAQLFVQYLLILRTYLYFIHSKIFGNNLTYSPINSASPVLLVFLIPLTLKINTTQERDESGCHSLYIVGWKKNLEDNELEDEKWLLYTTFPKSQGEVLGRNFHG